MTLPRPGDPARPIRVAVQWLRVVGGLCLFGGVVAGGKIVIEAVWSPFRSWYWWEELLPVGILLVGPGLAYLSLAGRLKRRKAWAAVAAIAAAGLHAAPGVYTSLQLLRLLWVVMSDRRANAVEVWKWIAPVAV